MFCFFAKLAYLTPLRAGSFGRVRVCERRAPLCGAALLVPFKPRRVLGLLCAAQKQSFASRAALPLLGGYNKMRTSLPKSSRRPTLLLHVACMVMVCPLLYAPPLQVHAAGIGAMTHPRLSTPLLPPARGLKHHTRPPLPLFCPLLLGVQHDRIVYGTSEACPMRQRSPAPERSEYDSFPADHRLLRRPTDTCRTYEETRAF